MEKQSNMQGPYLDQRVAVFLRHASTPIADKLKQIPSAEGFPSRLRLCMATPLIRGVTASSNAPVVNAAAISSKLPAKTRPVIM